MTARDKFFEHDGQRISYREAEVLLCCARGMTIKETADTLFINFKTVKRHRNNIHTRFNLPRYHAVTCFATQLLPELEKWVLWPIKMSHKTH